MYYIRSRVHMPMRLRCELLQIMEQSDAIVRSLQVLSVNLQFSVKEVVDKLVIFADEHFSNYSWNSTLSRSCYCRMSSRYCLYENVCANQTLFEHLKLHLYILKFLNAYRV
ncbi:hypothetical protein SARC_15141 [Sphaeroforma arctica JP610]|uniref:Uncharacterized protein n=1 Tax=Sphaeroforma arctica JP610 TaxID=667725 RepID=A0A0L0F6E1_9EUKA|nr:hypothetical protein SARC_15141 [Sphaeroforma arctica JP610]KNC72307.1 hypothetical protein SARC_15141 [Sphaeroforma arctica JP610]|eukprot:XP_014146209.1 hypothetical protein SARC_15141 [Sphaeroforma arctica JP610]